MTQQHHQGFAGRPIPPCPLRPSNLVIPAPPSDPASVGGAGYNPDVVYGLAFGFFMTAAFVVVLALAGLIYA